ncbi:MAG: exodeoxyribonuclease VII small subunit [Ignavibacteriales bacterium]|nr:exodeoxyribonuclease VII small subunit [Ignavibacteriales bacterium]
MSKLPKDKKDTFEHSLKRLEEIVESLEDGNVPLDDALKLYEEGISISKQCVEKLNSAELKLKRLSKDAKGNFELFAEGTEEA